MIDHVGLTVTDMARSLEFYDLALAPLGITRLIAYGGSTSVPTHAGYGSEGKPYFWIASGEKVLGYIHVALGAKDQNAVQAYHAAAIAAGGCDNGAPGLRPEYHPGYYGAFVLDPDGYNIEAVHHSFPGIAAEPAAE